MAQKLKADAQMKKAPPGEEDNFGGEVVYGVAATKLDRIIAGIKNIRQEKDDATAMHASEWKGAKEAGVHNDALKMALKLDNMEAAKRADWLRAFKAYIKHLDLEAQGDMFDPDRPAAEASVDPAEAGEKAGKAGMNRDDNPYDPGAEEFEEWDGGWLLGQQAIAASLNGGAAAQAGVH